MTHFATQLNSLILDKQLYLNLNYNLTTFSVEAAIPANTIRKEINGIGFKNYLAYINSFRIDHTKNLVHQGYLETYSIESLSKDSGFQAEVTFYRVFKSIHHCTPKEYSYTIKTNLALSV